MFYYIPSLPPNKTPVVTASKNTKKIEQTKV